MESRYYVYELVDPRDGSVFYVGKGCAWFHEKAVRRGHVTHNRRKCERIGEILGAGLSVTVRIVREGMAEADALSLESQLIASAEAGLLANVNAAMSDEELRRLAGGDGQEEEAKRTLLETSVHVNNVLLRIVRDRGQSEWSPEEEALYRVAMHCSAEMARLRSAA